MKIDFEKYTNELGKVYVYLFGAYDFNTNDCSSVALLSEQSTQLVRIFTETQKATFKSSKANQFLAALQAMKIALSLIDEDTTENDLRQYVFLSDNKDLSQFWKLNRHQQLVQAAKLPESPLKELMEEISVKKADNPNYKVALIKDPEVFKYKAYICHRAVRTLRSQSNRNSRPDNNVIALTRS